ncbi:hypothetical protein Y032_0067g34 [Ancylostoma ceylanicum]|nr:hypothetical protein Y032_0067g34 [Ancylostoma ceylanicum]
MAWLRSAPAMDEKYNSLTLANVLVAIADVVHSTIGECISIYQIMIADTITLKAAPTIIFMSKVSNVLGSER